MAFDTKGIVATRKTAKIKKMVEVEETVDQVTLTMTTDQARLVREFLGKVGPKPVANALFYNKDYEALTHAENEKVDSIMEVIYPLYNALYDQTY